jgi:hypothetical protein
MNIPVIAIEVYPDSEKMQRRVTSCAALQDVSGKQPFFLACWKAGELLKINDRTVSRWLTILCADGILKLLSKGGTAKKPRKGEPIDNARCVK